MTISLTFDHLAIACTDLETGARAVEAALGVALSPGGKHPHMGTHNRLLSLGPGAYLEVIAIDPDAPAPDHPRWFGLDGFSGPPRLVGWVARAADLDSALAAAPKGAGVATDLARGDLRWRMGISPSGVMPFDATFPALIEWQGAVHPTDRLPDTGCRLAGLTLHHPRADDLRRELAMDDPRLTVAQAPAPAITAQIDTALGKRLLA